MKLKMLYFDPMNPKIAKIKWPLFYCVKINDLCVLFTNKHIQAYQIIFEYCNNKLVTFDIY